jgi:type I restriction enzyme S subunit
MVMTQKNNQIPEGWVKTTLGAIVKINRGSSPRPIQKYLTNKPGIPWVKISDATASQSRKIEETKEFIIEGGRSTTVYPGDLIVSNSATPGIPKFMSIEACVHDGWLTFNENKKINDLYLYYFFVNFRKHLEHAAVGTVFKNLKTETVKNIELNLPPLYEQKAIAGVLGCLDDKIELLREQNKTLEALGQALFKKWFVDFNFPDKNGNPYKDSGGEMIESELGVIPTNWKPGKFVEITSISSGKRPNEKSDHESKTYNVPLYGASKIMGYVKDYLYNEKILITGRVGTHGIINKVYENCWPSDNTLVLTSKFFNFSFYSMKALDFKKMNKGAVQPLITQTDMKNTPLVLPDEMILNNFETLLNPIEYNIYNNKKQIQTLSKMRDTLLPELISGSIRVKL